MYYSLRTWYIDTDSCVRCTNTMVHLQSSCDRCTVVHVRVAKFAKFTVKEAFLNLTVPLMKAQSFDLDFSLTL